MIMRAAIFAVLLPVCAHHGAAQEEEFPYRLAPYKDELFAYQRVLDTGYGGDYRKVEYYRPRDLDARDVVRGRKAGPKYVSLDTQAVEADLVLETAGLSIPYIAVGRREGGAKAIVAFIHGRGADRHDGADDWIHGGNFNRIKYLMMQNEGLYLSPGFSNFDDKGTLEIKTLLLHHAVQSPDARIFLACGSWGGRICWRLVRDPGMAPLIGGLILLDSDTEDAYLQEVAKLAPVQRIPIHISACMEDWIIGWRSQLRFFRELKAALPDYPIKFVLFSAGRHGVSLRMTDWRETLNWMLSVRDGFPQ
jgi:hypothetical protein